MEFVNDVQKDFFTIRIPAELNQRLATRAATVGISKNAYILILIDKALKLENEKSPEESAVRR